MPRTGLRQRANRGRPRVLARPGATLSVRGESKPGADHGVQPQDAGVPRWICIMGLRKGTIRHPAPLVRRFERQPVHGGSNAAETGEQTGPEVHLHRFCTDADGNQKQVKTPSPKTLAISCKSGLVSFCLETTNWAVIDRPYSSGINTVGAVYDRATSVRKSFESCGRALPLSGVRPGLPARVLQKRLVLVTDEF